MRKSLFLFVLSAFPLLAQETAEVQIDLRNPTYKNGILYTNQGGVIKNDDIRIQARTIQYVRRMENGKSVQRIEAEGDLMIQFKGRVYVGKELEYDFISKTGIVYEGRTFSSMWYVGGDEIKLNEDGSYKVKNVFITTCENYDSTWDIHAGRATVVKNEYLSAKKVRFRFFKIPTFWLPSFKINLKRFKEPVFRYNFYWDRGQGPMAGFRYQLYSWQDFALYGRLEYRIKTGFGGAIESEYIPEHGRTTFITRSYLATDRLPNAPDRERRYRVQGALQSVTESEKTHTTLTWDKFSDVRMPGDFKSQDFEVNTAKKTLFYVHHQEDAAILFFKARPRVNSFESLKQDIPTGFLMTRPLAIGNSGIIHSSWLKASYLDFAYSDDLTLSLQDFRSGRFEIREEVFRPIFIGPLTLTPQAGLIALFYTNSPKKSPQAIAMMSYGGKLHSVAKKNYPRYTHTIEPYFEYTGITNPQVSPDRHYIFSIQDGYDRINELRGGIRQCLFSRKRPGAEATLTADLYANAFFSDPKFPQTIPKLYLNLIWNRPSFIFSFKNAWNFRHQVLDYSNARLRITVNEDFAFTLEGRYRSKYDWRKADHQNFILDVTRSESELLLSPISDRRITILTSFYARLSPFWEANFQSHTGFYRLNEKPYTELKLDLYTWISSAWRLRISYLHTTKDDRVTAGLSLIKK